MDSHTIRWGAVIGLVDTSQRLHTPYATLDSLLLDADGGYPVVLLLMLSASEPFCPCLKRSLLLRRHGCWVWDLAERSKVRHN